MDFLLLFSVYLFCILIAVVGIKLRMHLIVIVTTRLPAWIGIVIIGFMVAGCVCLFWLQVVYSFSEYSLVCRWFLPIMSRNKNENEVLAGSVMATRYLNMGVLTNILN
jgi:hypothetical protein